MLSGCQPVSRTQLKIKGYDPTENYVTYVHATKDMGLGRRLIHFVHKMLFYVLCESEQSESTYFPFYFIFFLNYNSINVEY